MIFVIIAIMLAIAVALFWSGLKGLFGSLGGQRADSTPEERHIPCITGEELLKVADLAVPSGAATNTESANPNTNPNATHVTYVLAIVFCNNDIRIQI